MSNTKKKCHLEIPLKSYVSQPTYLKNLKKKPCILGPRLYFWIVYFLYLIKNLKITFTMVQFQGTFEQQKMTWGNFVEPTFGETKIRIGTLKINS